MENREIIERLEKENEFLKGLQANFVNEITRVINGNKRLIADIIGKPYIDITTLDYEPLDVLIELGFITSDEKNDSNVKGLITWINKDVKDSLNRSQFKEIVSKVVWLDSQGKVKEKIPYLKSSLKKEITGEKEKASQTV